MCHMGPEAQLSAPTCSKKLSAFAALLPPSPHGEVSIRCLPCSGLGQETLKPINPKH